MTPFWCLIAALAAIAFCWALLAIGYRAGWRAGREDGDRRVAMCKLWWVGKLDEQKAEAKDFQRFLMDLHRETADEAFALRRQRETLMDWRN